MNKSFQGPRPNSVGIITKLQDSDALKLLTRYLPLLSQFHQDNRIKFHIEAPAAQLLKHSAKSHLKFLQISSIDKMAKTCDLILIVGGDGTMLRAARFLLHRDGWKRCVLLGINAGHLGFLTFLNALDAQKNIKNVLTGNRKSTLELRSCLQVTIERNGRVYRHYHVLNDCALSKGSLSRIFEFHVELDSEFLSSYRADGLIVSTPTGSTAYNLAAGGSIIEPEIPAIQLTPICPQSFSNKPIVVSDKKTIGLSLGRHSSDVYITLDGHTGLRIEATDKIFIRKSSKTVRFLVPPGMDSSHYFSSLRQKLKWGLVSPT